MRALVTGGAGFIGRALVTRLLAGGDQVTVLDNQSSPSPLGVPEGAELVVGSVVDPPPIPGRFDRIFHLASPASPPRYLLDPIGTLRTGAEGTRAMLERAAADGATLLFSSTSEVYGDPSVHPQSEDYPGWVQVRSPRACYDEAKRYAEALCYAFWRQGLLADLKVVRIFNTYGPGMHPYDGRVVSSFIVQALRGRPLTIQGDGSQTRSFCYVDDLVEGLLAMATADTTGPINLGNPEEITMNQLADRVAQLVGDSGRQFTPLPEGDPRQRQPDITTARRLLNWEPRIPLVEGLPKTVEYFRGVLA